MFFIVIIINFIVEWSTSEFFKIITGSKCLPATDNEIIISNLEHGQTYFFRCSAGNLKEFSDFQYPTQVPVSISSKIYISDTILIIIVY